jgi:hypothetical protein
MANGGARPGAGRPRGSRNNPAGRVRIPPEARQAVVEAAAAEVLSGRETCLEIMDRVMRGDYAITAEQFIAAKELAPYRFPKLSAIAVAQKGERTLVDLIALAGGNRDGAPAIIDATAESNPLHPTCKPSEVRQSSMVPLSHPPILPTIASVKSCCRYVSVLC